MWSSVSVCSPWAPLICTLYLSAIAWNLSLAAPSFGRWIWTEALKAVPRLVGQDVIYPVSLEWANFAIFSISFAAVASLVNTAPISAPGCIEIILSWSSSLTQTRKVLLLLWKMPLPAGQSLLSPQASRNLSPSLNKKWSAMSCF